MKILFIGDLYGQQGVDYLLENMSYLRQTYQPNLIIVNAENSSNGRGISQNIYKQLMRAGVSLITMGNHTWKNKELESFIVGSKIIRPINDKSNLGNGYHVLKYNDKKILVINALGRVYMNDQEYDNPFFMVKEILEKEEYDYSFLDFHAEATSEKVAMGHYLDGLISAIVGTHTHIQTSDNRMLPKGTLYITDTGFTGPLNGVIGVDKDIVVNRFISDEKVPNRVAGGPRQLNGVIITLSPVKKIENIHLEESMPKV